MDLTLPGYNYLGPGNSLNNGVPTNSLDKIAFYHDLYYTKLITEGINPYTTWNAADDWMVSKLHEMRKNKPNDVSWGVLYATIASMQTKKIANRAGLQMGLIREKEEIQNNKRALVIAGNDQQKRVRYEEKADYPLPIAAPPKRMEMDLDEMTSRFGVTAPIKASIEIINKNGKLIYIPHFPVGFLNHK